MSTFFRLTDFNSSSAKEEAFFDPKNRYEVDQNDFEKIPTYPIAYWISKAYLKLFTLGSAISNIVDSKDGLTTGDNEKFIRYWWEINQDQLKRHASSSDEFWASGCKWAPLVKGGSYRKWYGNIINVITYNYDYYETLSQSGNKLPSLEYYFQENLNWTRISSPSGSFRYATKGHVFESASLTAYSQKSEDLYVALAGANSSITPVQLGLINPTVNLLSGYFDKVTLPSLSLEKRLIVANNAKLLIELTKSDWDESEYSMDFQSSFLMLYDTGTLEDAFEKWLIDSHVRIEKVKTLEHENNKVFVEESELQGEVPINVNEEQITLTSNPIYRYGVKNSKHRYDELLQNDVMTEFISYGVGVMFGRYALDKTGLILANQGETLQNYLEKLGTSPLFDIDDDNIIPIVDESDYFNDDITDRFIEFVRTAFGAEKLQQNIAFIEKAIGKKIRTYFVKDFYAKDHVKRYKKRPIYWLFSSANGTFQTLIYMHRYTPDTLNHILNDYLRPFRIRLDTMRNEAMRITEREDVSGSEKTKASNKMDKIDKTLDDINNYEKVLAHYAAQRIEIDLDDGVKVNYCKFKELLFEFDKKLCK